MSKEREFVVGMLDTHDQMTGYWKFIIAVGGKAVVWHRSNGSSSYMAYQTRRGAEDGLARAKKALPDAEIVER